MSFFIAIPTPTILFLDLLGGGFYCVVLLFLEEVPLLLKWLGWFVCLSLFVL